MIPEGGSALEALREKARNIRLIAFDVDGVLTDGRVTFTSSGEELKSFDIKDGHGIKMALRAGLEIAFITGRSSPMVEARAKELGVPHLYQGATDKRVALEDLLGAAGVDPSQIAYLGDDLVDLPVIRRVGLGCAVSDAVEGVRERASLVTDAPGGRGAARELIVFILRSQGVWEDLMERYLR